MRLRIITNSKEHSKVLEQELQQRGFETEIAAAGNPTNHADIEIDLWECGLEEALQKAAELAQVNDTVAYVAPRALDSAANLVPEVVAPAMSETEPLVEAFHTEPALQSGAPAGHPTEFELLVSELETAMPDLVPASESSGPLFETAAPDEPLSDWPIWTPPVDGHPSHPGPEIEISSENVVPVTQTTYALASQGMVWRSPVSFWRSLWQQLGCNEQVFWRTATATAALALVSLVGVALFHRFSPLPAQMVPQASEMLPAPHGLQGVATERTENPKPTADSAVPGTMLKRAAIHASANNGDEADLVAPDTLVHYDSTRVSTGSRKHSGNLHGDALAEDTVVHLERHPASPATAPKEPDIKHYSDLK